LHGALQRRAAQAQELLGGIGIAGPSLVEQGLHALRLGPHVRTCVRGKLKFKMWQFYRTPDALQSRKRFAHLSAQKARDTKSPTDGIDAEVVMVDVCIGEMEVVVLGGERPALVQHVMGTDADVQNEFETRGEVRRVETVGVRVRAAAAHLDVGHEAAKAGGEIVAPIQSAAD